MKTIKMDVRFLFFAFMGLGLLLFFISCGKNELDTNKAEKEQLQNLTSEQNSSSSAAVRDEITYLEIPEEYLADPDVETILIEHEEVFVTEDGQEVVGYFIAETTEEEDRFRAIGVSQNLIDAGLVDDDLNSSEKTFQEHYSDCWNAHCAPPPGTQSCHNMCFKTAIVRWLFD